MSPYPAHYTFPACPSGSFVHQKPSTSSVGAAITFSSPGALAAHDLPSPRKPGIPHPEETLSIHLRAVLVEPNGDRIRVCPLAGVTRLFRHHCIT